MSECDKKSFVSLAVKYKKYKALRMWVDEFIKRYESIGLPPPPVIIKLKGLLAKVTYTFEDAWTEAFELFGSSLVKTFGYVSYFKGLIDCQATKLPAKKEDASSQISRALFEFISPFLQKDIVYKQRGLLRHTYVAYTAVFDILDKHPMLISAATKRFYNYIKRFRRLPEAEYYNMFPFAKSIREQDRPRANKLLSRARELTNKATLIDLFEFIKVIDKVKDSYGRVAMLFLVFARFGNGPWITALIPVFSPIVSKDEQGYWNIVYRGRHYRVKRLSDLASDRYKVWQEIIRDAIAHELMNELAIISSNRGRDMSIAALLAAIWFAAPQKEEWLKYPPELREHILDIIDKYIH